MKPSTSDILRKQLVPLSLLTALAALIWLGWPQLASVPSVTSRLWLTITLCLGWLLKVILMDLSPPPVIHPDPETKKQLDLLEGRLSGILRFLQKTPMVHHGKRHPFSVLPWHLIIGPKGAGKTSMLVHAGMRFVLSKKFDPTLQATLPPSLTPEWWVTRDLVLVDTPGQWSLMQGFLDVLQEKNLHGKLASAVIVLNLPELMQPANAIQREKSLDSLRQQTEKLRSTLGRHLSFYLIITKCDLLSGFTEFFRDSSREELSHAFGITLPRKPPNQTLQEIVCQRFNALIRKTNQQLVLRLHQERDIRLRPLIKDFPLELERLRDQIVQSIGLIANDLQLCGIWLTSALQKPLQEKELQTSSSSLSLQMPSLERLASTPVKPYFIRQVIQHALPGWSGKIPKIHEQQALFRRSVHVLSGGLVLSAALLFGRDFMEGLDSLHRQEAGIQQYAETRQKAFLHHKDLPPLLALLSALQGEKEKSLVTLEGLSQRLLHFYSGKAEAQAASLYLETLRTLLIPALCGKLDAWLKNSSNETSPLQLYQVLTARLMLSGDLPVTHEALVKALLETRILWNREAGEALRTPVAMAEQYHYFSPANPSVIERTRHRLTQLPAWQLGMLLLEDREPLVTAEDSPLEVPSLFTRARFSTVLQKDIPEVAMEVLQGNAVLGTHPSQQGLRSMAVISQLRNRYQQNYAKVWVARLRHLTPSAPTDLFTADAMITGFVNGESSFYQQLKAVRDNTALPTILQKSETLAALDRLLAGASDTESQWHQNILALNWLHQATDSILTAGDPEKTALQLVMQGLRSPDNNPFFHLHQLAALNPEPLKTWFRRLPEICWQLAVKQSGAPAVSPSLMTALDQARGPEVPLRMRHAASKKHSKPGSDINLGKIIPPLKNVSQDKLPQPAATTAETQPWTLNLKLPPMDV